MACPHCLAGEPSVWDTVLFHYGHPDPDSAKLKFCRDPWRERCRSCSADPGTCLCTPTAEAAR
jgi:hypothetical protein